jgi:hypothetical protein
VQEKKRIPSEFWKIISCKVATKTMRAIREEDVEKGWLAGWLAGYHAEGRFS